MDVNVKGSSKFFLLERFYVLENVTGCLKKDASSLEDSQFKAPTVFHISVS